MEVSNHGSYAKQSEASSRKYRNLWFLFMRDGRKPDGLRPLEVKAGVIPNANGSGYVRMGKTIAVAAVYGPRLMHPKHKQIYNRGVFRATYTLVPFSTTERVRPGTSRRSIELCKVIRQALEPVIFLEEYPKAAIDLFVDIISADSGTRTAGINAASVALADAGISMRGLVTAGTAGKIEGKYMLDLEGKEEDESLCDLAVAYAPNLDKFTLLQLDGNITQHDMKNLIDLVLKGCERLHKAQTEALRKRWMG